MMYASAKYTTGPALCGRTNHLGGPTLNPYPKANHTLYKSSPLTRVQGYKLILALQPDMGKICSRQVKQL